MVFMLENKGYLDGLCEKGFASLQDLFDIFIEKGGAVFVSSPFMAKCDIGEEGFIDGVLFTVAPSLVYEASNTNMITI